MTADREITLKEHIEKIFGLKVEALRREIDIRFNSLGESVNEAKRLMEHRMDGFPSQFAKTGELAVAAIALRELKDKDIKELKDALAEGISRKEYDNNHQKLVDDVKILMKSRSELEGKASQQALLLVLAVALSGMVFGIIGLIMRFLKV